MSQIEHKKEVYVCQTKLFLWQNCSMAIANYFGLFNVSAILTEDHQIAISW